MATLYIVATPIGNLGDISFRALEILRAVDLILCEDTRVTRKLLTHFGIKTPTLSYHQHSKLNKINYIIGLLKQGKDLALVSDAGTPGISDPGNKLVEEIIKLSRGQPSGNSPRAALGVSIIPIPGASALTAAASVSGFPMDRFLFLGFPPAKKKRKKFFEEITTSKYPVIFYESPYRILRTLKELSSFPKELSSFQIMVGRELTKKFEIVYRGTPQEVIARLEKDVIKGEFVVVVSRE